MIVLDTIFVVMLDTLLINLAVIISVIMPKVMVILRDGNCNGEHNACSKL